jgi:uncharacterized protein
MRTSGTPVTTIEHLRQLVGAPAEAVLQKDRARLHPWDRAWIAQSPFCLLATASAEGDCDVSPRGDPRGFVQVLDDQTLAIPERPGNKRADSLMNILATQRAGLLFVIPGRDTTLRVNGRATLVHDAEYMDAMVVNGHKPKLAIVLQTEQIFFHCAKAFMRSALWNPSTWQPDALPSHAQIVKEAEARPASIEELENYYGPDYAKRLY